jgi:molybdopterin converting factor small subunit
MNTGNTLRNSAPGWMSETETRVGILPLIQITIQGYLTLKKSIGVRQVFLPEGSSLRDSLVFLQKDLGEYFGVKVYNEIEGLSDFVRVLLNGLPSRHLPDGLSTILKDGDQVAIFPPLAGG